MNAESVSECECDRIEGTDSNRCEKFFTPSPSKDKRREL
jgi:hypothetical protein